MYKIKQYTDMGRGLCAVNNIAINTVICHCEILLLSKMDTAIVNLTNLKHYTFNYGDGQDCLVLGDGELFNHSDTPNVSYTIEKHDNRYVMVFRALRQIKIDEQLFIDYSADIKVNTSSYLAAQSLYGA